MGGRARKAGLEDPVKGLGRDQEERESGSGERRRTLSPGDPEDRLMEQE